MRTARRPLLALLALAAFSTPLLVGVGTTPALASVTTQTIAPGLTLTTYAGPPKIFVLTIDPTRSLRVNTMLAGPQIGDFAGTSAIADGHGALAGVNGDFTVGGWSGGDPGHPMHSISQLADMRLLGTAGTALGLANDLSSVNIDTRRPSVTFENLTTKARISVSDFNSGDPKNGDLVAYTSYGAGGGIKPKAGHCFARLGAPSKVHWATTTHLGVYRDWTVNKVVCRWKPLVVRDGTIVVSAGTSGPGSRAIRALRGRERVRVSWSMGWTGVDETVGGMPQIVTKGKNTAPPASCSVYFCRTNARTAVGVTKDGKTLLVVVNGGARRGGLTLHQLGDEMLGLGAVSAMNMDGSGGSTMWVRGMGILNQPSDGGERPVTSAILVMPASSAPLIPLPYSRVKAPFLAPGRTAATHRSVRLATPAQARAALRADLSDPGSTGGLMDALVRGRLGRAFGLPASFARMAGAFRAAHG